MKEVTLEVLHDAANRLLFEMSEDQYKTLLAEFSSLMSQKEILESVEGLGDYSPMTFPFSCENSYLREDEPVLPLSRVEALSNAGSVKDHQIKIPKVIG